LPNQERTCTESGLGWNGIPKLDSVTFDLQLGLPPNFFFVLWHLAKPQRTKVDQLTVVAGKLNQYVIGWT